MSLPGIENSAADEKELSRLDGVFKQSEIEFGHASDSNFGVLDSERDFATHIISVHDDSSLNPGHCEPSLWVLVSRHSVVF